LLLIQPASATVYIVDGTSYTGTGAINRGTVDFVHPTADFSFTTSGDTFLGFNNFHTDSGGVNADALYNEATQSPDNAFGFIVNGSTPQPIADYLVSALPGYDPVSHNYGYDPQVNGAIFNFGSGTETVSLVSTIAGQSGTGGNANVYEQSVMPRLRRLLSRLKSQC
jgi:hypothetical protein